MRWDSPIKVLVLAGLSILTTITIFPWERQSSSAYQALAQKHAAQRLDVPTNDLELDRRHPRIENFIDQALNERPADVFPLWRSADGEIYTCSILVGIAGAGCLLRISPDGHSKIVYNFSGDASESEITSPLNARERWAAIVDALPVSPTPGRLSAAAPPTIR